MSKNFYGKIPLLPNGDRYEMLCYVREDIARVKDEIMAAEAMVIRLKNNLDRYQDTLYQLEQQDANAGGKL